MAKSKYRFHCNACGAEAPKWTGQCPDCLEWNTLQEVLVEKPSANASRFKEHLAGPSQVCSLDEVDSEEDVRAATGISELDRVLGGGLVRGSVTLIGGDPGIGKSTLLLQMLSSLET
ncbi:MAG: ATPase domain-containing protein, partial [Gammaproteobacteria bacterium]